jgi:DNA polymerase I-like protein with 3'-5' exonuclease and polymerase domains
VKKKILMRVVDALLLPNPPVTREQYKKWVKESGLSVARNKMIEVEVDVEAY